MSRQATSPPSPPSPLPPPPSRLPPPRKFCRNIWIYQDVSCASHTQSIYWLSANCTSLPGPKTLPWKSQNILCIIQWHRKWSYSFVTLRATVVWSSSGRHITWTKIDKASQMGTCKPRCEHRRWTKRNLLVICKLHKFTRAENTALKIAQYIYYVYFSDIVSDRTPSSLSGQRSSHYVDEDR